MHTLIDIQKRAYIRQIGKNYENYVLNEYEIVSAKKKNDRYWKKIIEEIGIKDKISLLKNEKKKYCFTDEGAKLLEEVFYLYGLSKSKNDTLTKTKKNLITQIFVYKEYDTFVLEDTLCLYEDYIEANNMVVKVIDCFYKLFQDAGVPDEEIKNILWDATMKFRYSERKCYVEMLKIFKENIRKFINISQVKIETDITRTENAIWMDYAIKKIEEKMIEVFNVREKMKEIRMIDIAEKVNSRYETVKGESLELCKKMEEKIYEICINDDEVKKILEEYKKEYDKELDIGKILVILLMGQKLDFDKKTWEYFEKGVVRAIDHEKKYIKSYDIKRERILDKLQKRILKIIENNNYRNDYEEDIFFAKDVVDIRNEELLNIAIKACEENMF